MLTKIPGGYSYRGHTILRSRWTYYGRKRGSGRRGAMGNIHKVIFVVDGSDAEFGVVQGDNWFSLLRDAVKWIDKQEAGT